MDYEMKQSPGAKLGFGALATLVFGMMVGAGIFNIPQNMAVAAGPVGSLLAWLVTAGGMLLLLFSFKILSIRHPHLNAGIYLYARAGFGRTAGFMSAWGYWLCTAFANVAYAVMLNDTAATLIPSLHAHGWQTLLFGSLLIWGIYFVVIRGIRSASIFNAALSLTKFGCIAVIIVMLIANLRLGQFVDNFRAAADATPPPTGLWRQVEDSMMVTLWCFIGIEGAVMMAGRARHRRDVTRAGTTGFFSAWVLYVLVSMLSFGVMSRARLAGLHDPSVAYLLRAVCGEWAYWLVVASVFVSITGGWLAWSLVTAEVPYTAAVRGIFPKRFAKVNSHGVPALGLLMSSVIMEVFLIVVMFAEDLYLTALNITGMMLLPSYLLTALYLVKTSWGGRRDAEPGSAHRRLAHRKDLLIGIGATVFCGWMIYAGGIDLMLESTVFFLAGIPIARRVR